MGLLDKLWDDVVAGPPPEKGLGKLRKNNSLHHDSAAGMAQRRSRAESSGEEMTQVTQGIAIVKPSKIYQRSLSLDGSIPSSPTTPSPPLSPSSSSYFYQATSTFAVDLIAATPRDRENVWRSVFHPGSNRATKTIGSEKFDKAEPNSPTVYDWLYSGETRSKWR